MNVALDPVKKNPPSVTPFKPPSTTLAREVTMDDRLPPQQMRPLMPSLGVVPQASVAVASQSRALPPLQNQGTSAVFAELFMTTEIITSFIQEHKYIIDELLDDLDNDAETESEMKMNGGFDKKKALGNVEKSQFDQFHDLGGTRNKHFATRYSTELSELLYDSARDVAIYTPADEFGFDFTQPAGWGNSDTKAMSKILHGVENPRNATKIDERALKVAVVLDNISEYSFYFGPSDDPAEDLPASLHPTEKDKIMGIVSSLANFGSDLTTSFSDYAWIYDACIGSYVRKRLGTGKKVKTLTNIWDSATDQGKFTVDESFESINRLLDTRNQIPFTIDGKPYTAYKCMNSGRDVYNDPLTGIYKTLNDNRLFRNEGIKIELHMAEETGPKANAKVAIIISSEAHQTETGIYVIDSGFSVAELSVILNYVDTGVLLGSQTQRIRILKDIADRLTRWLTSDGVELPIIKLALIRFFSMCKYSGDDGTIEFAKLFKLIYLSGDNLAFTKAILNDVLSTVGSYLKIKSAKPAGAVAAATDDEDEDDEEDEEKVGADDEKPPNRPQFIIAKLVPDNLDSYIPLIEGVRLDIISGLGLAPATSLTPQGVYDINNRLEKLLASGNFFSNPPTMGSKITGIVSFNKLANGINTTGLGVDELRNLLITMKKINVTVSFVKNYATITRTLDTMATQMVRELPPRIPRRSSLVFTSPDWTRISKMLSLPPSEKKRKTDSAEDRLDVTIQQVNEKFEKNLEDMSKKIKIINDAHLNDILKINSGMVLFTEKYMSEYRKAVFSAQVQKWLGVGFTPEDKNFADQLINRVFPRMGGMPPSELSSIGDFMMWYLLEKTLGAFGNSSSGPANDLQEARSKRIANLPQSPSLFTGLLTAAPPPHSTLEARNKRIAAFGEQSDKIIEASREQSDKRKRGPDEGGRRNTTKKQRELGNTKSGNTKKQLKDGRTKTRKYKRKRTIKKH
jgi:hypothetical protein